MAVHTMEKCSRDGIGSASVSLRDVRHVFVAAAPRRGTTFREQALDALDVVAEATRRLVARGEIVHQAVFLADAGRSDECRAILREFYGGAMPATSYIPQPPCEDRMLALECLGVDRRGGEVEIQRVSEQLVVVRHHGIAWAHCASPPAPPENAGAYESVTAAFERVRALLDGAGIPFDRVIRTWLYCGDIGGRDGEAARYAELNRARRDFFQSVAWHRGDGPRYPASTGIGVAGRGVALGAIAFQSDRPDVVAVPLENPRQTSAYGYSTRREPIHPLFSRAMALSCGAYATIFISGTASIAGEDTRHPGDAARQTDETLDNIAALISEENLARHGLPGLGATLDALGMARVYLKRPDDVNAVRAVCRRRLGELPTIYAAADICRGELLVEIEGIAFARLQHGAGSAVAK